MALRRLCAAVVAALLAGLLTVAVSAPAQAEVQHPRQEWLRKSTAGLFLHWGMFTAPKHLNCAEWERDVTGGGWTPDYWIDEARKLGASYVVLATFHSRLGYARPWPSKIPGSCATQRDLLGELTKAGKAKGVKVILYMTDDPQWHSEQGVQMLDSKAYSDHKGEQVDLTTREGFGKYSYDLFFEVMKNYNDLAGFWIDNDNEYWERNKLYEQIRQLQPTWLLSNNNEDTPIMDTVSNEQKTGMFPSYDYPAATFTPMPRLSEACYKLPNTGDWWYDGGNHAVDTRLNTGRYITNAGASIKSLMAETPMVNGKMPAQQEAYNNFMSSWVPPIQESIQGVEGAGYMYGGMQPGFWNDGAHGVITINPKTGKQYVHVVTKPRADFVRLRDNGYRVTGVKDLRTGERMSFSQSGGHLTIQGITKWDEYDTVFSVETAGQQGFYTGVKASATSSEDGFPAANLTDGSYEKYWDANAAQPVSISLDLGRRKEAAFLAINQRESSPTHARVSFGRPEDSSRIKDYQLTASNDGRNWWHVRTGALPSARGTQFIDIGSQEARFLKLTVLNTWGGPRAPVYFKELKIDEIRVGHSYPRSVRDGGLEAEDAARSGSARSEFCEACSGTRQVTGLGGGERNAVTYRDVSVATAGTYRLQLDLTSSAASSVAVSVNGGAPVSVAVPADRADVPDPTSVAVPLTAGRNTLKVFSTGRSLGLDRISVGGLPPSNYTPKTTLTVEPHGVQWVSPGQQTVKITARLRLDADDQIDNVSLAPVLPAGWTLTGAPATRTSMRLAGLLEGTWTATSPAGQDVGSVSIPVTASFQLLSSDRKVSGSVPLRTRPADRVFVREAEDSANVFGSTGLTSCGSCSGAEKVRNIGGSPDAAVTFPNVVVPAAGAYRMFIQFTVNGPRSYFVTVNGGAPVEVKLDGVGNNTPYVAEVPVTLNAGANSIRFGNDKAGAPDLDQIAIA
ncbi:CBM35 domain-containing protein [Lentzea sp. BCCO 10_0856]|uniref:alpha-L-fucosidase n=1 Tax=Lentzea miocenica TaxID=3095431 RepID=A0ABU4TBE3_9PSEU|nr:CBM35 domain-containing protein [Lentzea sp. BCCO 10_0856]MDX8035471.1 CBM35 domain-containing protein [Lentzea sp. BCCO 10_0856]